MSIFSYFQDFYLHNILQVSVKHVNSLKYQIRIFVTYNECVTYCISDTVKEQ